MKGLRGLFLIGLIFVIYGCGGGVRGTLLISPLEERPERIAVLPFENFTGDFTAGERVRRITVQELVRRGYDVIEPGEINKILVELNVINLSLLGEKEVKEISTRLGVRYLIKGSVFSYQVERYPEVSYPSVALQVSLIDGLSGKVVRSTFRTEGGPSFWVMYFGTEPQPLNEVAKKVINEVLIDLLF